MKTILSFLLSMAILFAFAPTHASPPEKTHQSITLHVEKQNAIAAQVTVEKALSKDVGGSPGTALCEELIQLPDLKFVHNHYRYLDRRNWIRITIANCNSPPYVNRPDKLC